jgi:hypothetical protein
MTHASKGFIVFDANRMRPGSKIDISRIGWRDGQSRMPFIDDQVVVDEYSQPIVTPDRETVHTALEIERSRPAHREIIRRRKWIGRTASQLKLMSASLRTTSGAPCRLSLNIRRANRNDRRWRHVGGVYRWQGRVRRERRKSGAGWSGHAVGAAQSGAAGRWHICRERRKSEGRKKASKLSGVGVPVAVTVR